MDVVKLLSSIYTAEEDPFSTNSSKSISGGFGFCFVFNQSYGWKYLVWTSVTLIIYTIKHFHVFWPFVDLECCLLTSHLSSLTIGDKYFRVPPPEQKWKGSRPQLLLKLFIFSLFIFLSTHLKCRVYHMLSCLFLDTGSSCLFYQPHPSLLTLCYVLLWQASS